MKKNIFLLLLFLVAFSGFSQTNQLYKQSLAAYKSKDYALFLKLNKQLDSIRPSHPVFSYNVAAGYSLTKKENEAIAALKSVVLMNNTIPFEEEADFQNIKTTAGFQKVIALKEAQNKVIESSNFKVSLSEKDLHPEGLVYLDKQKLWLASSIRNKKIVSFDSKGVCSDWFIDTPYSVFALKADEKQRYLWVSCSAMPEMKNFTEAVDGRNEILKIDIKTRRLVKRYILDDKHVFGDLVVAKNGDVYISDSKDPIIYKIQNDKIPHEKIVVWKDLKGTALNLQGLTFNADQSKLFIADYLKGIMVVTMKDDFKTSWLAIPDGATKKGIDGMLYYKNSLIAIQNGAVPIRIVKYNLNTENTQITDFKVLDNNRAIFNEPALATISNGKLYFFANSPWKFYSDNKELDETKFENPKLFELQLD